MCQNYHNICHNDNRNRNKSIIITIIIIISIIIIIVYTIRHVLFICIIMMEIGFRIQLPQTVLCYEVNAFIFLK